MQRYIILRLGQGVLALLVISIVVFALARVTGSPLDVLLPEEATAVDIARVEARWGLDSPIHIQYIKYMGNVIQGDFGESFRFRGQVSDMIWERLPATVQLAGFAVLISVALALPIGIIVAVKKDTPIDTVGKIIALLGQSLPSFWLGIVLMWIFAVYLDWLPTSGRGGISHMILPGIALGWYNVAALMRLTRSSMLEVLDTEYVKLARIKGIPEWKVIWKHCFRNALIVPVTYFGLIGAVIMTGSVVIETVFSWPGVGQLTIEALRSRDYQVVQAMVLMFATGFLAINLLVDILYAYLDPRIRYT
jgi:peptide/nickel transport system permease protein